MIISVRVHCVQWCVCVCVLVARMHVPHLICSLQLICTCGAVCDVRLFYLL